MKISNVWSFSILYNNIADKAIPLKLSYKLNLLLSQYKSTLDFCETEINKVLDSFGYRDEQGHIVKENGQIRLIDGCENQVQELINNIYNLDAPAPQVSFTLEELEPLNLTIAQLSPLMECIKKPQD